MVRQNENTDVEIESEEETTSQVPVQVIEREVNLSLINDKLNLIISLITQKK